MAAAHTPPADVNGASGAPSSSLPAVVTASDAPAHACWQDATGQIVGCRRSDGTMVGDTSGSPTTCYFEDAELDATDSLSCDR